MNNATAKEIMVNYSASKEERSFDEASNWLDSVRWPSPPQGWEPLRTIKAQEGGQRDRYRTRQLKLLGYAIVSQVIYSILHFNISYELSASSCRYATKGGA
jgi:hypothetical protein